MERRRGQFFILAIALTISIIGLGIAFAAFSTTLTINGSATVQASSWDVYYTTTSTGSAAGTTGVAITPTLSNTGGWTPTATGTGTLKTDNFTWSGSFKTPGDQIQYSFYIRNNGDYKAKVKSITTPSVTCKIGSTTETTVCGYITYKVTTNSAATTNVSTSTTINSKSSQQIYVTATLSKDLPQGSLPSSEVTVNPVNISIVLEQTN